MKFLMVLILFTSAFTQKYASKHKHECDFNRNTTTLSVKNYDLDRGELKIKKRGRTLLHIDRDGELVVYGDVVETTSKQRRMLKAYVDHFEYIIEESIEIGLDGAKIGLTAASEAIKAVFTFDLDEMDRRLEKMDRKIEKETEAIEEKAEELEFHAEEFAAIRCILKRQIDELYDLDEF